ncbi:MAG TPA: OadG family protein [Gammaproteobacteria bacterium]|nr:OadG family protein [Gammaproteobacteria bacterium]
MSPLLQAGLNLTAIGMSVVFVLLTLLVGIIKVMSAMSHRIEKAMPSAINADGAEPKPATGQEIVSVISAAVAAYRKHR